MIANYEIPEKTPAQIVATNSGLLDRAGLMSYLNVGRHSAERIAEEAGAVVRIGKLWRANVKKIQAYIDHISQGER